MAKSMKSFLLPTAGHYKDYMSDDQCDGLTIIENEFGLKGFAIFIKLLQKICGSSEGYYIKWNDRVGSLFASELHVGKPLALETVNRMISEGLFDKSLYDTYGILTADYIQRNWYDVKKRSYKIEEAYRLIEVTLNSENVCKTEQNASKKGQNARKTPLIERNRIERNITERQTEREASPVLTAEERAELEKLSDGLSVESYLSKLMAWQKRSGKAVSSPYLTIRKWIEEDKEKAKQQKQLKSESSYDIEEWEKYAMRFDPNKKGQDQ